MNSTSAPKARGSLARECSLADEIASVAFDGRALKEIFATSEKTAHWIDQASGLVVVKTKPWERDAKASVDPWGMPRTHPYTLLPGSFAIVVPATVDGTSRERIMELIMADGQRDPFVVVKYTKATFTQDPIVSDDDPSKLILDSKLSDVQWEDPSEAGQWALIVREVDGPEGAGSFHTQSSYKATPWAYIGTAELRETVGIMRVTWTSPVLARIHTDATAQEE